MNNVTAPLHNVTFKRIRASEFSFSIRYLKGRKISNRFSFVQEPNKTIQVINTTE